MEAISTLKRQLQSQIRDHFIKQNKQLLAVVKEQLAKQIKNQGILLIQEQLREQIRKQKKQNDGQNQKLENIMKIIKGITEQINEVKLISESLEKIGDFKNLEQYIEEKAKVVKMDQQLIDMSSPNCERFLIQGHFIQFKKQQVECGFFLGFQLLGKIPISQKQKNCFTLIKGTNFKLGIIHPKYINDRSSWNKNRRECITYNTSTGYVELSGNKEIEANASKEGEKVVMKISKKTISWSVGGQIRAQLSADIIQRESNQWVPFIAMWYYGTSLRWE